MHHERLIARIRDALGRLVLHRTYIRPFAESTPALAADLLWEPLASHSFDASFPEELLRQLYCLHSAGPNCKTLDGTLFSNSCLPMQAAQGNTAEQFSSRIEAVSRHFPVENRECDPSSLI